MKKLVFPSRKQLSPIRFFMCRCWGVCGLTRKEPKMKTFALCYCAVVLAVVLWSLVGLVVTWLMEWTRVFTWLPVSWGYWWIRYGWRWFR